MAEQNYKRIESILYRPWHIAKGSRVSGRRKYWLIGVSGQLSFQHEWLLEPPEIFLSKVAHSLLF